MSYEDADRSRTVPLGRLAAVKRADEGGTGRESMKTGTEGGPGRTASESGNGAVEGRQRAGVGRRPVLRTPLLNPLARLKERL